MVASREYSGPKIVREERRRREDRKLEIMPIDVRICQKHARTSIQVESLLKVSSLNLIACFSIPTTRPQGG